MDGGDFAHRQPFREYAIVARGIKPLALIHFLLILHVLDFAGSLVTLPLERSVHAIALGDDAGSEGPVRHQQHLSRDREYFRHLAGDAVGRDDGHSGRDAAARAAVDEHHFRAGAGSVSDDARRHGFRWGMRLKNNQGSGAVGGR